MDHMFFQMRPEVFHFDRSGAYFALECFETLHHLLVHVMDLVVFLTSQAHNISDMLDVGGNGMGALVL